MALAALADRNANLQIEEYIVLDVAIGHAVRLAWLDSFMKQEVTSATETHAFREDRYDEYKAAAWRAFYNSSPSACASYVVKSLQFLTELGEASLV